MMKKELGPMAMHHNGPDNKATGNGKNSVTAENMGKIAQEMFSAGISGAIGANIGKAVSTEKQMTDEEYYDRGDYERSYGPQD
jgi:hypothetical protein